jgi:H+-translocating NAD(P) transhydrogenase subunit alpha
VRVSILTETLDGERRVAAVPETVAKMKAAGLDVRIQAGAGLGAFLPDEVYAEKGATVVPDATSALDGANVVLKVQPPSLEEVAAMSSGSALISFLPPSTSMPVVQALAERGVTAFSLELVPRTSRAQAMDALSSQALVAGYRCVLLAAQRLPKFLPMFVTAAGTVPPAKVLVLGTGVAGLQAIATARRLGAVVEAYDVRAAAKDEVQSLGATFIELPLETQEGAGGYAKEQSEDFLRRQRELLGQRVAVADIVITTAAIPGRRAPVLVTEEMVAGMRPGSVIVDLAAESGGNCPLSRPGEDVMHGGVIIHGVRNVPSTLPLNASQLLARNISTLLLLMVKDGQFVPDFADDIVAGCCLTHDGQVVHPVARDLLEKGVPA